MKHIFLQDHKRCSTYISDDGEAILRVAKAAKANEGCFTVKAVNEAGVATSTCVVVVNDIVVEKPKATKPAFYVPLKNQVHLNKLCISDLCLS